MTELYLLRHAHAGDRDTWQGPDDERPLTAKGRRQSEQLGRFLASVGFRPDAILTSPKARAAQTAELFAEPLKMEVQEESELGDDVSLSELESILARVGEPERVVLVGHDPDFSALVALLVGASRIPMKKGALARIDVKRPLAPGGGVLRWLVPPDLLGSSAADES